MDSRRRRAGVGEWGHEKTRSYGGLRVFGGGGMWIHQFKSASYRSWSGFASSGRRAGEVWVDSLAQDGELAKLTWIRQLKSVS